PQLPVEVQVNKTVEARQISVSWKYTSHCTATKFTVAVYDNIGENVIADVGTELHQVTLSSIPTCVPLVIVVRGYNEFGLGKEARKNYTLLIVPKLPAELRVHGTSNLGQVSVSWRYASNCAATKFTVAVYTTTDANSILNIETEGHEVTLSDLPICVPLTFSVRGHNELGQGEEARTAFTISEVPKRPSDISVETTEVLRQVSVTWNYPSNCMVPRFILEVYSNNDGKVIQSTETDALQAILSDLPVCVPLVVGVRGRNSMGNGPESRHDFSISAVPESPVDLVVRSDVGVTEVAVSWKYKSKCITHRFNLAVYDRDLTPIIQNIETVEQQTTVPNLPICVPLVVGVRGINDIGDGLEARTEFAISGVPGLPAEITVEKTAEMRQASVSWRYASHCTVTRFSLTVYNETGANIITNTETDELQATLSDLPVCVPLVVGVRGRNSMGNGPESRHDFSISADTCSYMNTFNAPDDRLTPPQINPVEVDMRKRIANVSWAVSQNAAQYLVTFYVGTDVTCTTSTELLQLTFGNIPVCKPLRVGVSAKNAARLSSEALSAGFYIPGGPCEYYSLTGEDAE
ncbi:hypothetical protein CSKR_104898, partial [Clonorchis sinensis]